MSDSRIEELLETLVSQNSTLIDKLGDLLFVATEVKDELNWVGDTAFAKMILDRLDQIELAIGSLAR